MRPAATTKTRDRSAKSAGDPKRVKAAQAKAEQSKAKLSKARQSKPDQNQGRQTKAKQRARCCVVVRVVTRGE